MTRRRPENRAGMMAPANGGRPFDGDLVESQIVWILGSPRTGSTWLLRLLAYPLTISGAPAGFSAPRGHRLGRDSVIPVDELYFPVHLTPQVGSDFEEGTRPDPERFLQNSLRASHPSYFFSDEYAHSWRPEVRRLALARLRAQAERGAGRSADDIRIAIKEPNGSHGAGLLMSLFPLSRMIFLVRDGRDVVASLMRAYRPGGWQEAQGAKMRLDRPENRLVFVREMSRLWVLRMEAVERAYRAHSVAHRFELHYEEMTSEPQRALGRILSWMGISRSNADMVSALEAGAADRPVKTSGTWRETLSAKEQDLATSIMGFKLRELGYRSE